MQDVSLERNDPNLVFERPKNDNPPERMHGRYPRYKSTLLTICVLSTKKPYPRSKCHAFRAKRIDERKNLIQQHLLCLRCLASTTHMAKDCKLLVKCTERESDKKLAALHVDGNPKPKDPEEV